MTHAQRLHQHVLDELVGGEAGEGLVEAGDKGQFDAIVGDQLELLAQVGEARRADSGAKNSRGCGSKVSTAGGRPVSPPRRTGVRAARDDQRCTPSKLPMVSTVALGEGCERPRKTRMGTAEGRRKRLNYKGLRPGLPGRGAASVQLGELGFGKRRIELKYLRMPDITASASLSW